jgi:hypothetical protein
MASMPFYILEFLRCKNSSIALVSAASMPPKVIYILFYRFDYKRTPSGGRLGRRFLVYAFKELGFL